MAVMFHVCIMGAMLLFSARQAQEGGWQANPDVVARVAKQQPSFNFEEAKVRPFELPDPLNAASGPVTTADAWPARRAEILELFREHVYGRSPGKPDELRFEVVEERPDAMEGAATLRRVAVISRQEGREHGFDITVFLPNARREPVPLFLLLNNRPVTNVDPTRQEKAGFWPAEEVIARGYGIAALQVGDLAPDDKERFRDGAIRLFEGTADGSRPADAWGALAAWAWGASRALDYFETDPRVDAARVAVVGHSRGGKAALWAGAEDERFALVVSNESGQGGAALSRRTYGETVARITEVFPHWFARNYASYGGREEALPVDQHMLIALIAPRLVYVASADEDLWADPRGEFLSQVHASPVYALWGDSPMRAEDMLIALIAPRLVYVASADEDLWADPRGEFLSLAHASPVFALWNGPPIRADDMPPLEQPLVVGRRGYHVRRGTHNLTPYDWARFVDFADRHWR